ncbi:hypothetical protein CI238_11901 [Colletotrichum incanum]|uniref:RNase H type-1 domain-containing protein n=1 Tax=Colletotrichum incanum TaxID=1573173 RepID=A0A167ASD5_COLIC|nr:hypothetical protein CI238_11901 [Colletotrichum incanum]
MTKRFASPLQRIAASHKTSLTDRMETIYPYAIQPLDERIKRLWDEETVEVVEKCNQWTQTLVVTGTSVRNGTIGCGAVARTPVLSSHTGGLITTVETLSTREEQTPFTAELAAISRALEALPDHLRYSHIAVLSRNKAATQASVDRVDHSRSRPRPKPRGQTSSTGSRRPRKTTSDELIQNSIKDAYNSKIRKPKEQLEPAGGQDRQSSAWKTHALAVRHIGCDTSQNSRINANRSVALERRPLQDKGGFVTDLPVQKGHRDSRALPLLMHEVDNVMQRNAKSDRGGDWELVPAPRGKVE